MTQPQQYAIVPRLLLDRLIYAVEQESMAYADPIAHVYLATEAVDTWRAAPTPSEQVLEDSEFMWHWSMTPQSGDMRVDLTEFGRRIERAVLQNLGAKNGE